MASLMDQATMATTFTPRNTHNPSHPSEMVAIARRTRSRIVRTALWKRESSSFLNPVQSTTRPRAMPISCTMTSTTELPFAPSCGEPGNSFEPAPLTLPRVPSGCPVNHRRSSGSSSGNFG